MHVYTTYVTDVLDSSRACIQRSVTIRICRGLVCDNRVKTGNPARCIIVIQWPVIYLILELFMIYLSSGAATWRFGGTQQLYTSLSSRELYVLHTETDCEPGISYAIMHVSVWRTHESQNDNT